MKKIHVIIILSLIMISGCVATVQPEKTSLEIQAIQAKQFETTKKIAFASVLSVFQDLGYIIGSADLETGFITAKSPTKSGFGFFVNVMENTKATAFIEELKPNDAKVRLNFVASKETSGMYGDKTAKDTPLLDPQLYQNAFSKIQEAIFIRSSTKYTWAHVKRSG